MAFVLVVMVLFAIFLKNIEESGCVALNMLATDIITGAEIEDRTFKISQAVGDQLYIWETDEHSICVQGKGTIYWQVKADGYQEADLVEVQLDNQSSTIYLDVSLVPSPKQLYSKTDSDKVIALFIIERVGKTHYTPIYTERLFNQFTSLHSLVVPQSFSVTVPPKL